MPVRNENTGGATGWCLEVHDLAISKLVAGRERDVDFLTTLLREHMVELRVLQERLEAVVLDGDRLEAARERLARIASALSTSN